MDKDTPAVGKIYTIAIISFVYAGRKSATGRAIYLGETAKTFVSESTSVHPCYHSKNAFQELDSFKTRLPGTTAE